MEVKGPWSFVGPGLCKNKEQNQNTDSKGKTVTYLFLGIRFPQSRPAGLESTLHNMKSQFPKVGLVKTLSSYNISSL